MEPPADSTTHVHTFHCNFARLPLITRLVHDILCLGDPSIQEKLPLEFLNYYVTALLWARLLFIKRCTSSAPLTLEEDRYLQHFLGKVVYLPEPIYKYLIMIGHISNLRPGWRLRLSDHPLPVSVAQSKGGYHAGKIHSRNNFRFEEIPSLGVSGDCIMLLASMGNLTEPPFPFLPDGTEATLNLVGYFGQASQMTEPVCNALTSCSITANQFKEDIGHTRLNIDLIVYVANIIRGLRTFQLLDFSDSFMSTEGSETQLIETRPASSPNPNSPDQAWTQRTVRAQFYPNNNNLECVEASYYAGFQLYKEADSGSDLNWCCVKPRGSCDVSTTARKHPFCKNIRRRGIGMLWGTCDYALGSPLSQYDATLEYLRDMISLAN